MVSLHSGAGWLKREWLRSSLFVVLSLGGCTVGGADRARVRSWRSQLLRELLSTVVFGMCVIVYVVLFWVVLCVVAS